MILKVSLIVLAILVIAFVVLYFVGKRLQKKVDSQQDMINSSKQTVSILVIDKKKQKLKDSNLPQMVKDQMPKYLRWRKMALVKAKIGPKIMTLMCDDKVFKDIPVKKLVKVDLAGIYIVGIKSVPKKGKKASTPTEPKKLTMKERLQNMASRVTKK